MHPPATVHQLPPLPSPTIVRTRAIDVSVSFSTLFAVVPSHSSHQGGQPSYPDLRGGHHLYSEPQCRHPLNSNPWGRQSMYYDPPCGQPSYFTPRNRQYLYPDPLGVRPLYSNPRSGHPMYFDPRYRQLLYPDPQGYQLPRQPPPQYSYPGSHGITQSASSSSAISHYRTYLKYVYGNSPISPNTKWPPSPGIKFISLAVVEGESCRDEYIGHTLQVEQVLVRRREISIEEILEPVRGQNKPRLVLMEGAPGIGKSTLAWELCRKWEELSCMQQYSLVVLLRLREEEVQRIVNISQLFCQYESEDKKSLVEEVSKRQGSGVLFILDGFDELPKTLQKEGFLFSLMRGRVLPASTVLVTSRPSATAELLTSCSPKCVEILGFTQKSVKAYASSIFSKPKDLKKFLDSISASENPAINSLMYVPLNAAIIVQIYLGCKSDALLPHTLTELYTLLCLTILNRDIMTRYHSSGRVKKIWDLSGDLHDQFLELSKIAFEGILNEEVVFHNVPDDFVHFGFLNAVSALYGGGSVSYNFLHLTLQEFFAAYHISNLGSSGLEVFKQHGKDERWNVVWRFVAGLTKFEHYKGHMDSDLFIKSRKDSETEISLFTIQCLFEAQSVDHFSPIFSTSPATTTRVLAYRSYTALDTYALGFCISNFDTGVSWSVDMNNHSTPFACGLKRKTPSVGVIRWLRIFECGCNVGELSTALLPPHLLTSLTLSGCALTNADLIHLSELIPHMTCLKKLDIGINDVTDGDQDGLLKILQQLSHSNVTTLNINNTGFCRLLRDSPHDYYSALKQLVCPSSGKLEELQVGYHDDDDDNSDDDDDDDDDRLASLVSAPSSLKSLRLYHNILSGHVSYLKNNTCLTKLTLWYHDWSGQAPHIAQILEHNKTLQYLELYLVNDDLNTIVNELPEEFAPDPRLHYKQF